MSKPNHQGWMYPNQLRSNYQSHSRNTNPAQGGYRNGNRQPKQLVPFGQVLQFPKQYNQHATKLQPVPRSKPRHINTRLNLGKHSHTGNNLPKQHWGKMFQSSYPIPQQNQRVYPRPHQSRVVASYAPSVSSTSKRRLVLGMFGLLIAFGVQGYWWMTHRQMVARLDNLTTRVEHNGSDLVELRNDVGSAMKSLWGTTSELSGAVAELRSPPSRFQDANGLYAVGRFTEAEAAFSAFLKESPSSRLADEALFKAGASAALSHNCSIALAHWGGLATRFPASSFNQRVADMKRVCSLPRSKIANSR